MNTSVAEMQSIYQRLALPALQATLKQCIIEADNALLTLASDATHNHQQNQYFTALQQLRIMHHFFIQHYQQIWLSSLYQTLPNNIDEEQLTTLRKLVSQFAIKTELHYLNNQTVDILTASHLINSFLYCLVATELSTHSKMLLLRLFENQLQQNLQHIQHASYQALKEIGVLTLEQQTGDKQTLFKANPQLINALADLQANQYELLDDYLAINSIKTQRHPVSVHDFVQQLNTPKALSFTLNAQETKIITDIQQLFAILLNNTQLCYAAKHCLRLLQLPYTRIALQTPSFFTDDQNLAKSILNEIIRLLAQWQISADLSHDTLFNKLKIIITQFWEAERIEYLPYQQMLFDLLLYEESERQQQQQLAKRIEESQQNAIQPQLIREQIDSIIQQKFAKIKMTPAITQLLNDGWKHVMYMIGLRFGVDSDDWRLANHILDDLTYTLQPPQFYPTRNDFLVRLPKLLKAIREGLLFIKLEPNTIHTLLDDLESEHKRLAVRIADSELNDILLYQARAEAKLYQPSFGSSPPLQQTVKKVKEPEIETTIPDASDVIEAHENSIIREPVITISPEKQAAIDLLNTLGTGANLLWNKEGIAQRCRIAAYIKHTKKYILIQPNGSKLAEFSYDEMVEKISCKEIESQESGQIFERALESLIDRIRDIR